MPIDSYVQVCISLDLHMLSTAPDLPYHGAHGRRYIRLAPGPMVAVDPLCSPHGVWRFLLVTPAFCFFLENVDSHSSRILNHHCL